MIYNFNITYCIHSKKKYADSFDAAGDKQISGFSAIAMPSVNHFWTRTVTYSAII